VSAAVDVAVGAGRGIGAGIGVMGGFRFIRWLVEFVCKRFDLKTARLDSREKALEAKFNDRLRHVEHELDRYRKATMLLVNALAVRDPQNVALSQVAEILRSTMFVQASDASLNDLVRQAGEAVDGVA
jgi:hypothetical protein